ncbi:hypothetical protein V6V47_18770, partial [Micromonospora sp. CPCC 205539]|uniref:hypothetical protein n=1 Tax=Micromonospora sp. CPCC 205539 TaxID=3122408 RepID=UPI002FF0AD7A
MAKHRASGDDQLTLQGVIETPGAAYWSVDDSRWPTVRPDLPADLVDLLAPPIVVGVARVPVTSRLTPPTSPADAALAVSPIDASSAGGLELAGSTDPVVTVPLTLSAAGAASLPTPPTGSAQLEPPAPPVVSAPVPPSAAAPAEPAPPPPAPAAPRPVPTPPLNPRPVPTPPHEPRPVPGPP